MYGTSDDIKVDQGGSVSVYDSGIDNHSTLNANPREFVYSGGTANYTVISAGEQDVLA